MEKLVLKTENTAVYIRVFQLLGAVLTGFFIAGIIFSSKYDDETNWIITVSGLVFSVHLALLPGRIKDYFLQIDDAGIHLENYLYQDTADFIAWKELSGMGLFKNKIKMTFLSGDKEEIKLRFHTKEQLHELESYLNAAIKNKGIAYRNNAE